MTTIVLHLVTCHDDVLLALLGHVDPLTRWHARNELARRGYVAESIDAAVGGSE